MSIDRQKPSETKTLNNHSEIKKYHEKNKLAYFTAFDTTEFDLKTTKGTLYSDMQL